MQSKKITSIAFTGAAATLAIGLGVPHAWAATTWHIKNGGTAYTGKVKGKNNGTTILHLNTGASLKCTTASASGSVAKASPTGTSPTVATITKATFKTCTLLGADFKASLTGTTDVVAKTFKSAITKGTLTDVKATITGASSGDSTCKATVTGSVSGSFHNTGHSLKTAAASKPASKLTITSAKSCANIKTNDTAYFKATYDISTPTALTISS
jgi:hypothetical protein